MTTVTRIQGGQVVLEDRVVDADLVVEGERIAAIEPRGRHLAGTDKVIDATGKVVLPGGVDPHVHVWEPGAPELEGFEAASHGAAAGGITTIIEMPLSKPPTVDVESFAVKRRLAEASCVIDFALWGGLLPGKLENVQSLHDAGSVGFKAFMNKPRIDYYTNLPDGLLLEAMRQVKAVGSLIAVHCENEEILAYNREVLLAAGRRDYLSHAEWRPPIAEIDAIQRVLLFAAEVEVSVHVVHLSTARGAEMIQQAKARGQAVTVETCPHYLLLDLDDLARLGPYANCDPPLRAQPNREQLWEHVRTGTIDLLASDHAPFSIEQKEKGHTDMWQVPMGVPGLQTMLPLLLDEAIHRRGLTLVEFARLSATTAARRFGLYPKKGAIRVGSDADLVLWDLNAPWTVDRKLMLTRHRWSPFEGRICGVRVTTTFVRGRTVYAHNRVVAEKGYGQFVSALGPRSPSAQFQPSLLER